MIDIDDLEAECRSLATIYIESATARGKAQARPHVPNDARLVEDTAFQRFLRRTDELAERGYPGLANEIRGDALKDATKASMDALRGQLDNMRGAA